MVERSGRYFGRINDRWDNYEEVLGKRVILFFCRTTILFCAHHGMQIAVAFVVRMAFTTKIIQDVRCGILHLLVLEIEMTSRKEKHHL